MTENQDKSIDDLHTMNLQNEKINEDTALTSDVPVQTEVYPIIASLNEQVKQIEMENVLVIISALDIENSDSCDKILEVKPNDATTGTQIIQEALDLSKSGPNSFAKSSNENIGPLSITSMTKNEESTICLHEIQAAANEDQFYLLECEIQEGDTLNINNTHTLSSGIAMRTEDGKTFGMSAETASETLIKEIPMVIVHGIEDESIGDQQLLEINNTVQESIGLDLNQSKACEEMGVLVDNASNDGSSMFVFDEKTLEKPAQLDKTSNQGQSYEMLENDYHTWERDEKINEEPTTASNVPSPASHIEIPFQHKRVFFADRDKIRRNIINRRILRRSTSTSDMIDVPFDVSDPLEGTSRLKENYGSKSSDQHMHTGKSKKPIIRKEERNYLKISKPSVSRQLIFKGQEFDLETCKRIATKKTVKILVEKLDFAGIAGKRGNQRDNDEWDLKNAIINISTEIKAIREENARIINLLKNTKVKTVDQPNNNTPNVGVATCDLLEPISYEEPQSEQSILVTRRRQSMTNRKSEASTSKSLGKRRWSAAFCPVSCQIAMKCFTFEEKYDMITVDWLNRRRDLSTRDFVREIMSQIFKPEEVHNRSSTGKKSGNQPNQKKAICEKRREFIFRKVAEKYADEDHQTRQRQIISINGIITTVCGQMGASYAKHKKTIVTVNPQASEAASDEHHAFTPETKAKIRKLFQDSPSDNFQKESSSISNVTNGEQESRDEAFVPDERPEDIII